MYQGKHSALESTSTQDPLEGLGDPVNLWVLVMILVATIPAGLIATKTAANTQRETVEPILIYIFFDEREVVLKDGCFFDGQNFVACN